MCSPLQLLQGGEHVVKDNADADVHQCECRDCRAHRRGDVARQHRLINRLLASGNERVRRLFAGFVAEHVAGGVSQTARITGLDRKTIAKGIGELGKTSGPDEHVRRAGGGRKRVEIDHPGS